MEEELAINAVPGISVSAASDEEHEGEFSLINDLHDVENTKERRSSKSSSSSSSSSSESEDEAHNSSENLSQNGDAKEVTDLADETEKVVLNDDCSTTHQEPYEVVGDRVLIEKDGKFELVDVNDVKADYFQMMGFNDDPQTTVSLEEKPANDDETSIEVKEELHDNSSSDKKSPRPKTSPVKTSHNKVKADKRVTSAYVRSRQKDEYAHIKSRYAMTEQQLEMKKRREEAIAKRKQEEVERKQEEVKQKQQDAERAFQAWLQAKNGDAVARRKHASGDDKEKQEERFREAESAFQSWLNEKEKQKKQQKTLDRLKLEEEASSYVIRERKSCEEAFNNWLKMKQAEARKKLAAKKPRRKRRKLRTKEPPPINSSSIRFTDYYGYRNTVAL